LGVTLPSARKRAEIIPNPDRNPFHDQDAILRRRPSALEDVLHAALQNSRRNLKSLEAVHGAVGEAITREKKQFERLHFWWAPLAAHRCLRRSNSSACTSSDRCFAPQRSSHRRA